jgi:DNA-binding winged helix-turn-helix (wHTH) protein
MRMHRRAPVYAAGRKGHRVKGKVRFGIYECDLDAMELRKDDARIRLQEQPFRVLASLLEQPGEIVTRVQLKERIWGTDTFVDFDQSLNKAVNRLRGALNDDAARPRYIETVPRRGYRFLPPVSGPLSRYRHLRLFRSLLELLPLRSAQRPRTSL